MVVLNLFSTTTAGTTIQYSCIQVLLVATMPGRSIYLVATSITKSQYYMYLQYQILLQVQVAPQPVILFSAQLLHTSSTKNTTTYSCRYQIKLVTCTRSCGKQVVWHGVYVHHSQIQYRRETRRHVSLYVIALPTIYTHRILIDILLNLVGRYSIYNWHLDSCTKLLVTVL